MLFFFVFRRGREGGVYKRYDFFLPSRDSQSVTNSRLTEWVSNKVMALVNEEIFNLIITSLGEFRFYLKRK